MEDFLRDYGYLGLFVALMAEVVLGAGLLIPGLTILAAAGFLAGVGVLSPVLVIPTAWAGVFVGDNIGYVFGRFALIKSQRAQRAVQNVRKRFDIDQASWWWLFFHFPVVTRSTVPVALGASAFPLRRWLPLSASASLLFSVAFGGLGYVVGRVAGDLATAERIGGRVQATFAVLCLVLGGWVAVRLWRHRPVAGGPRGEAATTVRAAADGLGERDPSAVSKTEPAPNSIDANVRDKGRGPGRNAADTDGDHSAV